MRERERESEEEEDVEEEKQGGGPFAYWQRHLPGMAIVCVEDSCLTSAS